MLGEVSSFGIGALVFMIDAFILALLVASMLGQPLGLKSSGLASLLIGGLVICKTFFLLTSLFICFKVVHVSPLPFVLGSALSLVAFVGFMYVVQNKQGLSAKN